MSLIKVGAPWTVRKVAEDEPEEGESGTIYVYEVVDKNGTIVVSLYDEDQAAIIAAAPALLEGAEDLFAKLPEAAMLGAKLRLAVGKAKEGAR